MNDSLKGRRALVTGASRGIGRAIACELAAQGASVAINFLNSKQDAIQLAETLDAAGTKVVLIRADVAKPSDVTAMVEETVSQLGGLDIVISNAAAGGFRELSAITPVSFEATIRNNASPVIWLLQAAIEHLTQKPGGEFSMSKFVAVSSHGSRWAVPHYSSIGASKAALESLIRHMAMEYGRHGINFNCVLPGIVQTEAIASMPEVESVIAAAGERMLTPREKLLPEDVASTVAFLCSQASDMIQGQTLIIDGGVSIRV